MKIPESLLARIKNRKCALFLGAGATISSGGALGSGLGKYIFDSLGDTGIEYRESLSYYTEALVKIGYRDEIENIIRKRFKNLKPAESFARIADVPWKAIYTTNYDDLVEKAYKRQNYFNCVVNTVHNREIIYGINDIPLYKINGDINTPYDIEHPLVIALRDFRKNKKSREKLLKKLMIDLCDTFVFVGYSFQDKNEIVTNILDVLSDDERWESVKEKYVVLPNIDEDTEMLLSQYRITYIKGTADEFFQYVGEKAENDYKTKLAVLHHSFENNIFLSRLKPQSQQYLVETFDIYEENKEYSSDGKYYYRGGQPNWGIIKNGYDVSREVTLKKQNGQEIECTTFILADYLKELLIENKVVKVLLRGTAISGKSTTIYRIAYEMNRLGILSLIYKQQAKYREGLLTSVYQTAKQPFIVFIDDVFIDTSEVVKMVTEAFSNHLSIVFVFSSRYSDWENRVSSYYKKVLSPFELEIEMSDTFTMDEATYFVDKLTECGVVEAPTKLDRRGLINNIKKNNNILEVLFEIIDSNQVYDSIATEYSAIQTKTQEAYGIISLVFRYGYKIRWEVLQRTLNQGNDFSWENFVELILKREAKGNIFEDEIQGSYYLLGRNRYICKLICDIHYSGNYTSELEAIKSVIDACIGIDTDEKFIGGVLNAVIKDEETEYETEQIISLLNYAIDAFEEKTNQAFVNHLRGEFYVSHNDLDKARKCFEANVQNELNLEYSLHSLGKTYFFLAQRNAENPPLFILYIDKAIQRLFEGVRRYRTNEFYYSLLITIFDYLQSKNAMSEKNEKIKRKVENFAIENIGEKRFTEMKQERNISMD